MPDRGDIAAFFDGTLTYRNVRSDAHPEGRTYVVPEPDAKTGLWLSSMGDTAVMASNGVQVNTDKLKLDDDEERSLYQVVLGPVYDEMMADGVSWTRLKGIATDAFLYHAVSADLADFVRGVAQGEAPARDDRADKPKTKATSTKHTRPRKAGSGSKKARMDTPDPHPSPTSTPSSNATPTSESGRQQAV